jgi:hypothetical protein
MFYNSNHMLGKECLVLYLWLFLCFRCVTPPPPLLRRRGQASQSKPNPSNPDPEEETGSGSAPDARKAPDISLDRAADPG